jgi:hypothetical protein
MIWGVYDGMKRGVKNPAGGKLAIYILSCVIPRYYVLYPVMRYSK